MSGTWRRSGLWIGAAEDVSPEFVDRIEGWLTKLPAPLLEKLSEPKPRGVCVWLVRRLRDYNPDYFASIAPRGWDAGKGEWDACAGLYFDKLWREGRFWRPAVLHAEEWAPHGAWETYRTPYVLYHELGHAFDCRALGYRPACTPEFRRAYMRGRERAKALPEGKRLRYFLWHWSPGIQEVFADAFAAHFCRLPLDADRQPYEPAFRAAFPECIEYVDALIDAAATPSLSPEVPIVRRGMIRHVRQEDPMGCGIACVAMVTGRSYREVAALLGGDARRLLGRQGLTHYVLFELLSHLGFACVNLWRTNQLNYRPREPWPPAPLADAHICLIPYVGAVEVGTPGAHFVVWLRDGTVLDPAKDGRFALVDYAEPSQVIGCVPLPTPLSPEAPPCAA